MTPPLPLAVFLHSGDYDRMHQGLSAAAAAVAMDRPVRIFLFWWALERVTRDALDEPVFSGREDVEDRFEATGAPTLRVLLSHLRESSRCQLYACSGSAGLFEGAISKLQGKVDAVLGWSSILELTAGVADRLHL